jgi:flagellar motor switch protein FliG
VSNALVPRLDPSKLSGRQKLAVLCAVLGADAAAAIAQHLHTDDAAVLSLEIARLQQVSPDIAEHVLTEWAEHLMAADTLAEGGVDYAGELLEKAFGPAKAGTMLKRVRTQLGGSPSLERLRGADPQRLGSVLRGEHPQTIALILAQLDAVQASETLADLDPQLSADVLLRMARLRKVSPEVLHLIERSLTDTDLEVAEDERVTGGPRAVAAVLNALDGPLEKELLSQIGEHDEALGQQIRQLMFVFEDLTSIDARSMQRLLRDVDSRTLATALKSASAELKAHITSAMPQRAMQALLDEMEMLGAVRIRDVEAAQAAVIQQARVLEEAGEIVLGGSTDEFVE